ncbi:KICSTOR complex protein ITFG2-like isoform X2 [Prorops nasuta]
MEKDTMSQEIQKLSSHASTNMNVGPNLVNSTNMDQADGTNEKANELGGKMECVHVQRVPTNTKIALVADIDNDGSNELILGLTDRVVRSYKWSSNSHSETGKLVGLSKWECTNQIGTVTLQHTSDGTPTLLVAQPGGTFMRIKCSPESSRLDEEMYELNSERAASCVDYQTLGISTMRNPNISTEIIGDLKSGIIPIQSDIGVRTSKYIQKDNLVSSKSDHTKDHQNDSQKETKESNDSKENVEQQEFVIEDPSMIRFYSLTEPTDVDQVDGNFHAGNIILGEYNSSDEKKSLLPTFKDFSHISNSNKSEVSNNNNNNKDNTTTKKENEKECGDTAIKQETLSTKPYALATLDGTIMLVKDDIILWAMQVDHQIFSLCQLDVTGDGSDEIVACAWDGQTYILDQQRNSVRFQFEESVRAFCTGNYNVIPGTSTPCLVYNTFNNKIFIYYDVILPSMKISPLKPEEDLSEEEKKALWKIIGDGDETERQQKLQQFTEWLLYEAH